MRHQRSGAALLSVGLLFLLIVSLLQGSQRFLTRHVTDQVARTITGGIEEDLAASALAEANTWMSRRLNTAGDPLRQRLIQMAGVSGGNDASETFVIPAAELAATGTLMRKAHSGRYVLEPVSGDLRVARQARGRPGAAGGGELHGVLSLRARVRSTLHASRVRTLRTVRSLRVCLLTLPVPLAEWTVLVRRPHQLLTGRPGPGQAATGDAGVDVNALIEAVSRRYLPDFELRTTELAGRFAELEKELKKAPSGAQVEEVLRFVRAVRRLYDRLTRDFELAGEGRATRLRRRVDELVRYPADPDRFMLGSRATRVQLVGLTLQRRLAAAATRLQELSMRKADAYQAVKRDLDARRTDAAALANHLAYSDLLLEEARTVEEQLETLRLFQAQFEVIEGEDGTPTTGLYRALATAYALVDPADLAEPFSRVEQRATHLLEDEPPGEAGRHDISALFRSLVGVLDPAGQGVQGLVVVRSRDEVLSLGGRFRGMAAVAVAGALSVSNLDRDRSTDTLVLIAADGPNTPLRLAGRVTARVVATGRRVVVEEGSQLTGSLVLEDVSPGSHSSLAGEVLRDGDDRPADGRVVLVSPWTRWISVEGE